MGVTGRTDEQALVDSLRRGDERALTQLVERHTPGLLRVARSHVRDASAAEDVVQETWLALVVGIDRFEQRSSVKTWLYQVVLNRARTRGVHDARTVPVSTPQNDHSWTVNPNRFRPADDAEWPGHWSKPPRPWQRDPQVQLQSAEILRVLYDAIEALPPRQREIIVLRDVEGLTTEEVAATLELGEGNVRVLLHRGRAKVRNTMEEYLA